MNTSKLNNKPFKSMAIRNKSGVALAFFSIFLPVLIGFIGLVIDMSQVYAYSSRIKSATDMASLAGISQLQTIADITSAKTTALTYLNNNLTMTIPNFMSLSLPTTGLTIQGGVYDFTTAAWTFDESSSSVNSIKVAYTYSVNSLIANYFMISSFSTSSNSIAAKNYAGTALTGTSFPQAVNESALTTALSAGNVVNLYVDAGGSTNSYFTNFDNTPSSSEVINNLQHFRTGGGTYPNSISIGSTYTYITNALTKALIFIIELFLWAFSGGSAGTFIFPVVSEASGTLTTEGFVGAQITSFGLGAMGYYTTITIIPGYIDNTWSGCQLGADPTVTGAEKTLLANAYGIVQ